MILHRPIISPFLSPLLRPLIFLVVIGYYFSSYTCASALAQPEDETPHKMVLVPDIAINAVGDPIPVKLQIDVLVNEDNTLKIARFRQEDLDMARREPDAIVSSLIRQFNSFSRSERNTRPDRFGFHLAEPLPNYTTDEPEPDQPYLEDNMWQLDPTLDPITRRVRMEQEHWQPWYNTFYLDGPLRMVLFYIGTDRKLYSGLIEIPPEAVHPAQYGQKVGYLRRDYRPTFRLDFVRDLDNELRMEN